MSPDPKVASSRRACSLFSFSFLPCVLGAKHYHTRDGVADSASESSALEASSRRLLAYPGTAPRALLSWPEWAIDSVIVPIVLVIQLIKTPSGVPVEVCFSLARSEHLCQAPSWPYSWTSPVAVEESSLILRARQACLDVEGWGRAGLGLSLDTPAGQAPPVGKPGFKSAKPSL